MSSNHDVTKMVDVYKRLFLLLAIITVLGIGMAYVHLPVIGAIIIAFAIMFIKSKIVVDSLKHLIVGRNLIVLVFVLTAIFFAAVILLPLFNHQGFITGTQDLSKEIQMQQKPAEGEHRGN